MLDDDLLEKTTYFKKCLEKPNLSAMAKAIVKNFDRIS